FLEKYLSRDFTVLVPENIIVPDTSSKKNNNKHPHCSSEKAAQFAMPSPVSQDLPRSIAHSTYFYYFRPSK
ncbi:hypothetical protein, partial [Phocaeicola sp.]|uniref:hypothetical protein n=1 Tax=Phocaeicola sp. TaxID=2773926 RepID=UPI003A918707